MKGIRDFFCCEPMEIHQKWIWNQGLRRRMAERETVIRTVSQDDYLSWQVDYRGKCTRIQYG